MKIKFPNFFKPKGIISASVKDVDAFFKPKVRKMFEAPMRRLMIRRLRDLDKDLPEFHRAWLARYLETIPDKDVEPSPRDSQLFERNLLIAFNTKAIQRDCDRGLRKGSRTDGYAAALTAAREIHKRGEGQVLTSSGKIQPSLGKSKAWDVYRELRPVVDRFELLAGKLTGYISERQSRYAYQAVLESDDDDPTRAEHFVGLFRSHMSGGSRD